VLVKDTDHLLIPTAARGGGIAPSGCACCTRRTSGARTSGARARGLPPPGRKHEHPVCSSASAYSSASHLEKRGLLHLDFTAAFGVRPCQHLVPRIAQEGIR
jgi:hypothetical protein